MEVDNMELEHQLMEVGNKLSNPPRLTDELLLLLDQAEKLLYQVCQSPEISMLHALKPSMKALIQDDLLRHSDVDVKVAVASCISEITRITAPDAAYDNDQMRDVFQLIVTSFEDLADQSSRSYIRRASILETVSKVRSCVMMLHLKCDGMIVEMFEHFLRSIRDYHRGVIYSSMENIMILVLEESREISVEMLKPLLATVKKHNQGVLPIAEKLGEEVLKKSAEKLKPYLMPALTALGDSLDSYTEIVTRVCEGTTAATKRDDENASWQLREVTRPAINLTFGDSSTNLTVVSIKETNRNPEIWANFDSCVMSDGSKKARCKKCGGFFKHGGNTTLKNHMNKSCPALKAASGSSQTTMGVSGVTCDLPVSATPPPSISLPSLTTNDSTSHFMSVMLSQFKGIQESMDKKLDHMGSKLDVLGTKVDHLDKSVTGLHNNVVSLHEKYDSTIAKMTTRVKKLSKEVFNFRSGCKSDTRKNKRTHDDSNCDNHEGEKRGKRARSENIVSGQVKRSSKENTSQEGIREKEFSKQSGKKVGAGDSDVKQAKQSAKNSEPLKSLKKVEKRKRTVEEKDSDSDAKPLKLSAKKGNASTSGDVKSSSKKKDDGRKCANGKNVIKKDEAKTLSSDDEMDASPKSAKKPAKGEDKDKFQESDTIKYDESLVGKKVKLWWPEDKTYYEGVIKSYDAAKKEHKVSYVDESEENLYLKNQKWAIIQNFSARDKESDTIKYDESLVKSPATVDLSSDSDSEPLKSVKKVEKRKPTVEEKDSVSDAKPLKLSAKKGNASTSGDVKSSSKKKDDGRKCASGKNVIKKDEAKTLSSDDEMDVSPKSAKKPAKGEDKDKESNTIKYDESLVGKKVKLWWPEDKTYYEGVIKSYDAAKKEHKISYVDESEEKLYLKNQKWAIIQNFSARDKESDTIKYDETLVKSPATVDSSSDSDVKPQKQAGKKALVTKEAKCPATILSSDSDLKPQKHAEKKAVFTKEVIRPATIDSSSDSDLKPQKQAGKKAVVTKEVKLPSTIYLSEDDEATRDSDEEPPVNISKNPEPVYSGSNSKQSGKKVGAGDSDAKQAKQSVKKSDAKKSKQTGKTSKQSAKKEEDSDSDSEPLKCSKQRGVQTRAMHRGCI